MTAPLAYGPRSSTVQVVEAPVVTFVTLTTVPNGRLRWAHVPDGALYHVASPLSLFCGRGAVVVVVGRGRAVVVAGARRTVVVVRAVVAVVTRRRSAVVGVGGAVVDVEVVDVAVSSCASQAAARVARWANVRAGAG